MHAEDHQPPSARRHDLDRAPDAGHPTKMHENQARATVVLAKTRRSWQIVAVHNTSHRAAIRRRTAMSKPKPIHVIGGGLAGSEAAWQIARAGVPVVLHEMRPVKMTAAHTGEGLAELVCSNSFRSDDWENNAVGLLHEEMRRCGSLIMRAGDAHKVPAGGALAVDRVAFSDAVQAALEAEPLITIAREEIAGLPPAEWDSVIIATGPLTSPPLADRRSRQLTGEDCARLLRRHRADRAQGVDRPDARLVSIALRQGRRRRLHQLPDGRGAVPRLHRRAARRREDRRSRIGKRTRPISKRACRSK